ncbi:MAG: carboxypeptidase M32 [Cypionkella sp.]
MSYAVFQAEIARINDILCAINLMGWDARTVMPAGGVNARAHQVTTLTVLARDMATGDGLRRAMDSAKAELAGVPAEDMRHRALAQAEAEIGILRRIPAQIITEMAGLKTRAHAAWVEARAANDFAAYAPMLGRMMEMQRLISAAIGGGAHPYDPLIAMFEPDMTYAELQGHYGTLKSALAPLIARAKAAPQPRLDFLSRSFPIAAQKAFGMKMAERLGYDLNRGRLDDTIHPFEISFTRDDVRITSRFRENWLPGGVFALWHEAGHGIYEQNIAPEFSRSIFTTDLVNLYAVGGASFGMHESQSRLWENRVGRSKRFWELHYGELRDCFPTQLADVSDMEFWRAINSVQPGFIRVEADELTYDLHIILRSEIEAGLMSGDIQVKDLPGVWKEKMQASFGLDVPNDTLGVLQDVHWSHGYLGSFPTYTLGNIMSSQFFRKAQQTPAVSAGLQTGDYGALKTWLAENIYRHGRSCSPKETVQRVTGGPLDPAPYIADLTAKVDVLTASDTL